MSEQSPMQILGIPLNASKKEIRKAYFKKIRDAHPDRGGEGFIEIHNAYLQLSGNLSLLKSYDTISIQELTREEDGYYYKCKCSQDIPVELEFDEIYECCSCSFSFQLLLEIVKSPEERSENPQN